MLFLVLDFIGSFLGCTATLYSQQTKWPFVFYKIKSFYDQGDCACMVQFDRLCINVSRLELNQQRKCHLIVHLSLCA
jgi:hypothetical protein